MSSFIGNGKYYKGVKYLEGVIRGQVATMAGYNFIVERILFDGEGALRELRNALLAIGIKVELNPGNHVPKAEALIKAIKGYCRG
jgi:hypothetical protein